MKLHDILKKWEAKLPLSLQEKWDHGGLNLGSREQDIKKVLFAYDICHEVLREAIDKDCGLIISHHPFRMKADVNIRTDSYEGQTISLCCKHNIALYSCHTNHDSSALSLNRHYLEKLGLKKITPLIASPQKLFKLAVFVPATHATTLMQALFEAGGGTIGNYDECSFRAEGTGTFRGNDKSHPAIGRPHKRENVAEERVEILVVEERLGGVLAAMKKGHPYEEIAHDIYALENRRQDVGLGAIGDWDKSVSEKDFLARLKKLFHNPFVRFVKSPKKSFRRVAICTGSGTSLMEAALRRNADVFITGDVKYHQGVEAKRQGLAVADVGHFYSEIAAVTVLKKLFDEIFAGQIQTLEYKKLRDVFVTC